MTPSNQILYAQAPPPAPNLTSLVVGTPTGKTQNIGTDPIKITLSWTDSSGSKWKVFEGASLVGTVTTRSITLQPLEKGIAHCYTIQRISPTDGSNIGSPSNSLCSHVQPVISSVTQTAADKVTIAWTQAAATNPAGNPTGYAVERVFPTATLTEVCNSGSSLCASATFTSVSPSSPSTKTHVDTVAAGKFVCYEIQAAWASPRINMDSDKVCITTAVLDTTPPVLTVPDKARAISTGATTPVSYSVTATDSSLPINLICKVGVNPVGIAGDNFADGVTQVDCTATDAAGISSNKSFNVYVSKLSITNEPYSIKWNRVLNLKVDAIGFAPGDIIQVLRGTSTLGSLPTSGDSDTTQHFDVPLAKFPSSDSGTSVNVNAVLVETLDAITNYGSDATGITILPHSTSITTSTFSDGFPGNSVSEIGTIFDDDDLVQVSGLPITFSGGLSLPATTSSGITITDNSDLSISSGNLLVHKDTTITNPSFYEADITFKGLLAGNTFEFVLTPVSGALTPNTQIWSAPTDGDLTIPLYFGGGELIKEIKITTIPTASTTAKISNIVIRNSPGDIVHDITFTGTLGPGVKIKTENIGRFSSNSVLVSPGVTTVTASYVGISANPAYSASSGTATPFNTQAGVGGSATITADSGMGIAAVICSSDGDKDYLCDNWEGTGATDGIPFVVTNYVTGTPTTFYYKLPGSDKIKKDIYVESDYMTGHTPDTNAILDVKNLFATKNIVLHHTIDQVIPHSSFTALWGDTNMVIGDDFNSLKMTYFGSATEHPTLGGTVTVTCTDCATSASSHTLKISGITLQTPSTTLTGGTTSGKVTVKATVTLLTNTAAVVHKITSPSVAGTNAGVKIGPMTTSDLTVTGSTPVKTFTITVPFSTVAATGSLVNLGDISIPFTTKATADVASAPTSTTASVATAGSPRINTSLTDAISQGVHYIPWIHTIGTSTTACGPSGQSELPGNDGVVSLGCNFNTVESGFAYPAGDARKATVGDRQQQAGTFLHELSHNLGINHGGPQVLLVAENGFAVGSSPADTTVNCKPQYTSVMSYTRQFPSYLSLAEWTLNLSSGGHTALTENSLVETTPVAGSAATLVWGTPTTSPTTLSKKGLTGVGLDWNNNGAVSGTVAADINNVGISGCNTPSISTTPSYDWNDWANLDLNLRKATGGQFDGLLGEETPEVVKQANILSSKFDGFYNPPPYDNASQNIIPASTTPLKVKIISQTGETLVVKLRGEYRLSTATTPSNTYTKMVCGNDLEGRFEIKDAFNQCGWKIPSNTAQGTKIFIKIWLNTEGANPPEMLLIDQSPPVPTPAGGFPYKDLQGNIVTNYVTIK